MFSWNDTIDKMNKENAFKRLIMKTHELWSNGRIHMVLLYSNGSAVGFDKLKGIQGVIKHINENKITTMYVKTANDSYMIDITKYDTYQHLNDINTLVIFESDRQVNIHL